MTALELANQVRIDRKELRLRIKAGEESASRVLEQMPACMKGCGVYTFLTYLPLVGKGKAEMGSRAFTMIRKARAPGHKRLDQLTPLQLERLTRVVREYEESRHPAERGLA